MRHFGDIMFTDAVKAKQAEHGSRAAYEKMTAQPAPPGMTDREAAFIAARDSFYIASVTETGWPYVQHRGGPKGFLKVIASTKLGFADYRGNKQYVTTGNTSVDDRVSLFLMDYPNRARLKILGHATAYGIDEPPELAAALSTPEEGRAERFFEIDVAAFDWNCPQFITPRFTADDIEDALAATRDEIEKLRTENAKLKAALDR